MHLCQFKKKKKRSKTGPHTRWGGEKEWRKRQITPDWWVSDLMSEVISKRLNPKHWFFREGIHQLLNLILWAQHPQRASLTVHKIALLLNLSSWNQFIEQSQLGGKWLYCFLQSLLKYLHLLALVSGRSYSFQIFTSMWRNPTAFMVTTMQGLKGSCPV